MSFQAYMDNIKAKTGKDPDEFRKFAEKKDLYKMVKKDLYKMVKLNPE